MSGRPRVLVVGAGAVGQVFGHHLQRGGAELTFFVREKYRAATAAGFELFQHRLFGAPKESRLEGFDVVCSTAEVRSKHFDQIYLALPSQALTGPWLRELVEAAGDATWISTQPGPDDRQALLDAGIAPERLVSGMLTLVSYPAPLPTEKRISRPGMAFWHPPVASMPVSGPRDRVEPVIALLRRGGFPVRRHQDVHREVSFFTAVLLPYLAALERSGWSLRKLSTGRELKLGAAAARETAQIVTSEYGPKTLPARLAGHSAAVRLGIALASKLAPFPLEPYLRLHFTKTNAQTRFILEGLRRKADQRKLRAPALTELLSTKPALEATTGAQR